MRFSYILIIIMSVFSLVGSSCTNPEKEDQEHYNPTPGGKDCSKESQY